MNDMPRRIEGGNPDNRNIKKLKFVAPLLREILPGTPEHARAVQALGTTAPEKR